jgi:hypothetical protein
VQAQKKDKEKTHSLIVDLKKIALKLGKTPTRDEFCKHSKYTKHDVNDIFKSFTIFVESSGLKVSRKNIKPFDKDIEKEIKDYTDKKVETFDFTIENARILIIGDTHFPFVDEDAMCAMYEVAATLKPNVVIQIGDLYDMFAQGKFPRSLNNYNPQQEIDLGNKMAKEMWASIQSIVPEAKCFQMLGNHCVRPIKRIIETAPECEPFFSLDKYLEFKNVQVIKNIRQELLINNIMFIHGYRSRLGDHRDFNISNTVCGHSHTGGVSFKKFNDNIKWELNAGYLADPKSKALGYTPQRLTRWTHGVGFVDQYGPRFIPFD